MTTTSYGPLSIWAVVIVVGLLTFVIRYSFIYLLGWVDGMPPRLERALRFVPAAVLAALVAPSLVDPGPSVTATLLDPRLLAGVVAGVVAWTTENMFATLAAGMVTFWAITFLL
ncbi:AzlD domain-containing protein [Haloplanus halophilus]|uniref:AzlD domain-containing protein n=1 Tax=Haloplanus halophilus TaxID=2949993 RepID=UPI00203F55E0|nr:AzlD domain-containing protein [Haloplanus sp. GDY1]